MSNNGQNELLNTVNTLAKSFCFLFAYISVGELDFVGIRYLRVCYLSA